MNIKIAANISITSDFYKQLIAGDFFAITIANEGYCLLDSEIFSSFKYLISNHVYPRNNEDVKKLYNDKIINLNDDLSCYFNLLIDRTYLLLMSILYKELELRSDIKNWDIKFDYHDNEKIQYLIGEKYPELYKEIKEFINFYDWNFKHNKSNKNIINYNIYNLWKIHEIVLNIIKGEIHE